MDNSTIIQQIIPYLSDQGEFIWINRRWWRCWLNQQWGAPSYPLSKAQIKYWKEDLGRKVENRAVLDYWAKCGHSELILEHISLSYFTRLSQWPFMAQESEVRRVILTRRVEIGILNWFLLPVNLYEEYVRPAIKLWFKGMHLESRAYQLLRVNNPDLLFTFLERNSLWESPISYLIESDYSLPPAKCIEVLERGEWLVHEGIQLAIVSNSRQVIDYIVSRCGEEAFAESSFDNEDVKRWLQSGFLTSLEYLIERGWLRLCVVYDDLSVDELEWYMKNRGYYNAQIFNALGRLRSYTRLQGTDEFVRLVHLAVDNAPKSIKPPADWMKQHASFLDATLLDRWFPEVCRMILNTPHSMIWSRSLTDWIDQRGYTTHIIRRVTDYDSLDTLRHLAVYPWKMDYCQLFHQAGMRGDIEALDFIWTEYQRSAAGGYIGKKTYAIRAITFVPLLNKIKVLEWLRRRRPFGSPMEI